MDSVLLNKLYPLNLLNPEGRRVLGAGVKIEQYREGDYIYRLWEETRDLLYVLKGKVQILYVEDRPSTVLSSEDAGASKPFTHGDFALEAAIALEDVRILRLDFERFSQILSLQDNIDIDFRLPEKAEEPPQSKAVSEPELEPLELPDFSDDHIQLKPVNTRTPYFRKKAPAKQLPTSKPAAGLQLRRGGGQATPTVARAAAKSAVAQTVNSSVKTVAKTAAKPAPSAPVAKQPQAEVQARRLEKLVRKLKHELTVERTLNINLLKSQSNTQAKAEPPAVPPAAPAADVVEKPQAKKSAPQSGPTIAQEVTPEQEIQRASQAQEPVEEEPAPAPSEIDQYLNAMTLYREQKWESAHAAFQDLFISNPTTNLYKVYAARCSESISQHRGG